MYAVTDIDIDLLDVACDLGMKLHLLVGSKFTSDRKRVGERRAPNLHNSAAGGRLGRYGRRIFAGMAAASSTGKAGGYQAQGHYFGRRQRRSHTHFRTLPFWYSKVAPVYGHAHCMEIPTAGVSRPKEIRFSSNGLYKNNRIANE